MQNNDSSVVYELINKETGEIINATPTEFGGEGEDAYVVFSTEDGRFMTFKNPNQTGQIVDENATDGTYIARQKATHVQANGEGTVHDVLPAGNKFVLVNKNSGAKEELVSMDTYEDQKLVKVMTATIGVDFKMVEGEDGNTVFENDTWSLEVAQPTE